LTEGRFLIIESGNSALAISADNSSLVVSNATETKFDTPSQRFVIHATDPTDASANTFRVSAGPDFDGTSAMYITPELGLGTKDDGAVFSITFLGASAGYVFQEMESGKFLVIEGDSVMLSDSPSAMKLFSVTF